MRKFGNVHPAAWIVVGIMAVALVIFVVFYAMSEGDVKEQQISAQVSQLKAQNTTKEDAANVLADLLNTAKVDPSHTEKVEERIDRLAKGDYTVLDKDKLDANIHFSTQFQKEVSLRTSTYSALVSLSHFLSPQSQPLSVGEGIENVYLDADTGRAFVPLQLFVSDKSTPFSVEMVFVDGRWKLAPYSLLEQVRYSAAYLEMQDVQNK